MKKIGLFGLLVVSLALTACFSTSSSTSISNDTSSVSSETDTDPVISGVQDEVTIALGETFNALQGVTATDAEDGSLTNAIVVSSIPTMVLTGGVYTPEEQGEYYITYSVTDSDSNEVKEFTTLTVTRPVSTETLFKEYEFVEAGTVDLAGWESSFSDGAAGTMEATQGHLVVDVTAIGTADYHAKLAKYGVEAVAGADYELKVTMYASVNAKMHFIINNGSLGWSPEAGTWNLEVGTNPAVYSLKYNVDTDTNQIEYLLQMGGDLNAGAFKLYIDQVELLTSVGTETEESVADLSFANASDDDDWGVTQAAGATSSIAIADEKLVYTINTYDPENQPWNINLYYIAGVDLVKDSKYRVSFDVTTVNDQFYELCFEDHTMDWQVRAGFNNGTFSGTTSFGYTFNAGMDITGLYIKLALGRGSATSNIVTIDNFKFVELVGDKETTSEVTVFSVSNEEAEWGTYNANGGVGNLYIEEGSLFYAISSFGATDWYNKFFIKKIKLEAGALYRVEFTVSADKTLKGFFALNVFGKWDPRITKEFDISATETTYSYTLDSALVVDMDFELLFQFGGYAQNVAPATIEFSSIKIYKLS